MNKLSTRGIFFLLFITLLLVSHIAGASVYTVTSTSNNAGTSGSLPWAVAQVNAGTGGDVINFSVTGTISITAQLTLNKTVTIDGTSAPGYTSAPVIEVTNGASVATAFTISAANCTIKGLCITGFSSRAINIATSGNTVAKCYIGIKLSGSSLSNGDGIVVAAAGNTIGGINAGNVIGGNTGSGIKLNSTGSTAQGNIIGLNASGVIVPNAYHGIVAAGTNNTIGGSAAGAGNILSGNGGDGVLILSQGNTVKGNKIGVNGAGTTAAGNTYYGIEINDANNTIGGSAANEGNIISGNGWSGINIASTGNVIKGNKIGVDITGAVAVPNEYHGIEVYADNNTVGGSGTGEDNIISGNMGSGIILGCNSTIIKGNTLGMNAARTAAIPNGYYGIEVDGSNNIIGGLATGEGNFIAGNLSAGINIYGGTATSILGNIISKNGGSGVYITTEGNLVKGNKIGVDATGSVALPNIYHGIEVNGANNIIGGLAAGEGNIILKNGGNGIHIDGGTTNSLLGNIISDNGGSGIVINTENNIVKSNKIGMNIAGTAAAPNVYHGIVVSAAHNTIGGSTAGEGNILSGNGGDGLLLNSADNTVKGNKIGVDETGAASIGNAYHGIEVNGANNIIGGVTAADGNRISGNAGNGININGGTANSMLGNSISDNGGSGIVINTENNIVKSNKIGMNIAGTAAAPNVYHGIVVSAAHNTIGGSTAGEGNILSGNGGDGLLLNSADNMVKGNKIGVDETGTAGIPNEYHGIEVNAANTIGGSATGEGNLISGNHGSGIYIGTADGISLKGNIIGMNATATTAISNRYYGVEVHSSNNYIGGSGVGEGNNISGNGSNGVIIYTGTNSISGNVISANSGSGVYINSGDNILKGNIVGMDASGTAVMPNEPYGIEIYGVGNAIGGSAAGEKNIVSGNTVSGVYLGADSNTVMGNIIGMNAAGTTSAPNGYYGVHVDGSNNIIGDTISGTGNIICGNGVYGVTIFTGTGNSIRGNVLSANAASGLNLGSDANSAYGNIIGMDATGTAASGNGYAGIEISGSDNHIGGSTPRQRNLISGNAEYGIMLGDGAGNMIKGNYIGTDRSGTTAIANGTCGIVIDADHNHVGGTAAGEGNLVSGNTVAGVAIFGRHNTLQGNIVGLDATGTTAIGNGEAIMIQNANNIVGGSTAGSRNIISGNNGGAVIIYGTNRDTVQGNYIGVDITGTAIVPNMYEGVVIHYSSNTVTSENIIAGNGTLGVLVSGNGIRNKISANSIYDNGGLGIDIGNDGVTENDALDTDFGPNGLVNFPSITSIAQAAGNTTISGNYDGAASGIFTIELFSNNTIDSSGHGEGKIYIGSTIVNTDGAGHGTFSATVSGSHDIITATATNSFNSTSEFSGTGPQFVSPTPQSLATCFNASAKDIRSLLHVSAPQLGQTLTWSGVIAPTHGTVSIIAARASSGGDDIAPGGVMTYEPAAGYLGADSFTIQVTDGISYDTLLVRVTVHPNPVISAIGATTSVCELTPLSVYSTISGAGPFTYAWSGPNGFTSASEDTLITLSGTSDANGSYQLIVTDVNNCSDTATTDISLYQIQPIVGATAVAFGNTIMLSNSVPGGTWASPTPWITKVTAGNGNVKGVSTGVSQVSYTTADGCVATHSVTVYSLVNACVGQTITLSDGTAGGTWTSNVGSIATVGLTTGIVTGVSAGKAIIRHFVSAGAIITTTVTVNPLAATTVSAGALCQGQPFTLTNATPGGGTWYSSNAAIAIVSSTGIAMATGAGAVTIYFTPVAGCATAKTVTITAVTPITGVSDICVGQTIVVSNSMPGGVWSTSSGALVQITSTGVAKGMAAGTPRISYIWPTGCQSIATVTVKALSPITGGTPGICAGSSMTLANATPFGGVWSSSNTNAATVSASGFVKGTGVGTTIISFTTNVGGCVATRTVTVNACRQTSEDVASTEETITGVSNVKLFPNPNKGEFTITGTWASAADEEVSIEVTNMLGQVIYRNTAIVQNTSLDKQIRLQGNLASGTYILNLQSASAQKTFRFVID